MNYLLDTSVIIDFFRGKPKAKNFISQILDKGSLFISIITYAELIYGAKKSTSFEKEKARIDSFIKDLNIQFVPLSIQSIEIYADIKINLEKKGRKLDEFDLLIASSSMEQNCTLVTLNINHFKRIKHLEMFSSV